MFPGLVTFSAGSALWNPLPGWRRKFSAGRSLPQGVFLSLIHIYAQVKGTVKDAKGNPIFMANVFWLGATQGTSTAENGSFSIEKSSESNKLIASSVGFANDRCV